MLTQLIVSTYGGDGDPLELPLVSDGAILLAPFQIQKIDGIGPVKANINTSQFGDFDGEAFYGSSIPKRNIVLTMGLNPDWADQTVEGLRQELYKWFMPKLRTKLKFVSTHLPTCEIDGYVESLEPNIFSKDPEIQISIICPTPDFIASAATELDLEVGTLTLIDYIGTVPTGLVVALTSAYTGGFELLFWDRDANPEFEVEAGRFYIELAIDATHSFELSSVVGNKFVQYVETATGDITTALPDLNLDSDWPQLLPGPNTFLENADSVITGTITYFARFGGL